MTTSHVMVCESKHINFMLHAGLIRGEEVNEVQRKVNLRLERLQHARHWHLPPKQTPPSKLAPKDWLQRSQLSRIELPQQSLADTHAAAAAAGGTAAAAAAGGGIGADQKGAARVESSSSAHWLGSVADLNYTSNLRMMSAVARRQSRRY
jgi:hypothetical protein